MAIFYINMCIVYACTLCARVFKESQNALISKKNTVFFAFVALTSMILVSGLRNNIGDTFFYMYSYVQTSFNFDNIVGKKDVGFNIFQMILQSISSDPQLLIFVVALITNILVFITLYKYSKLLEISFYVYITSGLFLMSMNGIRQFLAASIAFAASKYIFNGDWKRYILVILLAGQIHQSAFILIPIYFIVRRKAWSWTTSILIVVSTLIVLGFNEFTSVLFSVLENNQYNDYKNFSEGGTNVIRVAVWAVPVIIAYLGREKLRAIFPQSDYVVNMCLIALLFMFISTQNWIFARFTFYFGLYCPLLMSWILQLFVKRERKFLYYAILVFYFVYYFYENVISLNIKYGSNFIKF